MSVVYGTGQTAVRAIVEVMRTEFGASNVGRGRYVQPPTTPWVGVAGLSVTSSQGPPMRYWQRTAVVDIDIWDGAPDASTDARVEQAEDLALRATNALEAAKADPTNALYLLDEFEVESAAIGADFDAVPEGFCRALLSVRYVYIERGT